MKFANVLAVQAFLAEVGAFDKILNEDLSKDYVPTNEESDTFIKRRTEYQGRMKNYRKSSKQKSNWRENRTKMMKGIKAFHRSVEGKRFHRKLGRFLSSRITRKTESLDYTTLMESADFLIGLNSVKQHLFVELDYFHTADEQIELEEMVIDYAIPVLRSVEQKIVENLELNEDEVTFMMDLVSGDEFLTGLSEVTGKDLSRVSESFQKEVDSMFKESIAKDHEQFYPILVKRLSAISWETI